MENLKTLSLVVLCFFIACSGFEKSEKAKIKKQNAVKEFITRQDKSYFFPLILPKRQVNEVYPWEENKIGEISKISKEFFRCKGTFLNPVKVNDAGDILKDCVGSSKHSLPIINGHENVYPILIDILNYIQKRVKKKVVITCGHRCPDHNVYADSAKSNRVSKHMIGAEVDFYVKGMEEKTLQIMDIIFDYYKNNSKYEKFERLKNSKDVKTPPWYNSEILVKLFTAQEGRDFDNRHPYPYISIQVRNDSKTDKRVTYTWEKAYRGFMRW